ncbi:MAG: hypothetical protein U9P14_00030 [Gemmatimonadota bacterium]|nr:hypothetical protein [Gemmatimonadota bacterium]
MKAKFTSLLLGLVAVLSSCSTPEAPEFNQLPVYDTEVVRAWGYFRQDNYLLSATGFRQAMEYDTGNSEAGALIGLAWSLAMQDSLGKAIDNFQAAISRDPESPKPLIYALAGLSFCYRDFDPPYNDRVRDNALAAITLDSTFVFEYKSSINYLDLEAVLAEAYFNLANYDSAAVYADPHGALDTTDSNYHKNLLTKINELLTASQRGG